MSSSQNDSSPSSRPLSMQPTDDASTTAPAELSAVVDELLTSLTSKFSNVSNEIFAKMDEMSKRLDSLEAAVQANTESKGVAGKS